MQYLVVHFQWNHIAIENGPSMNSLSIVIFHSYVYRVTPYTQSPDDLTWENETWTRLANDQLIILTKKTNWMNSKIVISHTKNRYPSYFGTRQFWGVLDFYWTTPDLVCAVLQGHIPGCSHDQHATSKSNKSGGKFLRFLIW